MGEEWSVYEVDRLRSLLCNVYILLQKLHTVAHSMGKRFEDVGSDLSTLLYEVGNKLVSASQVVREAIEILNDAVIGGYGRPDSG